MSLFKHHNHTQKRENNIFCKNILKKRKTSLYLHFLEHQQILGKVKSSGIEGSTAKQQQTTSISYFQQHQYHCFCINYILLNKKKIE